MNKSKQTLITYIDNFIRSIKALHKENCIEQSLLIVFSFIDTLGLVDNNSGAISATRTTFKEWLKEYTDISKFNLSEEDVYAARCGVLHAFTSESDLSRKGSAKEIQYYLDSSASDGFKKVSKEMNGNGIVTVPLIEFYNEIKNGAEKMLASLNYNDPGLEKRIASLLSRYVLDFNGSNA